jgi:hypothetical protein
MAIDSHAESKLENQWLEIFRAGDYGDKGTYTERDLDQIASSYDPSFHEVPLVIGHPQTDAPAYGWVSALKRDGDTLLAKPSQVDPNFEEMVLKGRFKKRSVSFYRDDKGISLRHVGFLGAEPPAVKGLADARFSAEVAYQTIEFADGERGMQMADIDVKKTVRDSIREFFAELFSEGKTTPKTFSEDDVRKIAADAATAATGTLTGKIAELEGKLTSQAKEFSEGKKKLAAADTANAVSAAISGLKTRGKWLPAYDKMGLPLIFAELAKSAETIEFGEGDQKKKLTPIELLTGFVDGFKAFVPKGEVVAAGTRAEFAEAGVKINAGRSAVDANSVQLTTLANKLVTEKKITFSEALKQAAKEHPELTQPGGASSGAV